MRLSMPSSSSSSVPDDPAASALFAAAAAAGAPYSAGRKILVNNAFVSLRSSGWLLRLDRLCLPAAESQAQGLIDWITLASYSITGGMTFAANLGLTGDATTGFINTGLAPSAAVHYTANKAMFGVAISSTRGVGQVWGAMGTQGAGAAQCYVFPWYNDGNSYTIINAGSSGISVPTTVHGIYMANRPDAGNLVFYRNTTVMVAAAIASGGLDTATFLVNAVRSDAVTVANFSGDTNAGFWIGDGATNDADQAVLYGIINTYLTAIGAL